MNECDHSLLSKLRSCAANYKDIHVQRVAIAALYFAAKYGIGEARRYLALRADSCHVPSGQFARAMLSDN